MGTLSVVATPIGNLGDITLRAIETFKNADVIACEDTRVTSKLLARLEIKKPLIIFHARNLRAGSAKIEQLLQEGKRVALVTDAGTPGISDPGSELVTQIREQFPETTIEAIPGASALTAALSIAGLRTDQFVFLGFLPNKKGRQTLFKEIADEERTVVFYESPHRIVKALESLKELLPDARKVVVLRELTKMYEEYFAGSAEEVLTYFTEHADKVRGEFVVIVSA